MTSPNHPRVEISIKRAFGWLSPNARVALVLPGLEPAVFSHFSVPRASDSMLLKILAKVSLPEIQLCNFCYIFEMYINKTSQIEGFPTN